MSLVSVETEQSVLGVALRFPEEARQALAGVTVDCFDGKNHRAIWNAIGPMLERGEAVDIITVFESLASSGAAEKAGGLLYLNELADAVLSAANAKRWAQILREKSIARRSHAIGLAIQQVAAGPTGADDVRARLGGLARDLERLQVPADRKPSIPVEWASDMPSDLVAPAQIVEGVLAAGGMSMMYGESNSGKSYLAIHLCICVTRGAPWLGKRTQKGAVLYVAAEGAFSIRTRLAAFVKHYKEKPGAFGLIPCSLSLVDPSADVESLVELIRAKAAEIGEPILLVVVDTVARVLGGGDENAAQDMGRLVSAGDYIREATGAHLLYIHHAGKDSSRGARGHSSLRAALDTEIEVTADEGTKTHTARITKQRDLATKGEKIAARFVPVELGFDQWGSPITACAVVATEAPDQQVGARRLTPAQQAVMGYLAGHNTGARRALLVTALEPQGVARASVYRAVNELLNGGLVVEVAGQVYLPKEVA